LAKAGYFAVEAKAFFCLSRCLPISVWALFFWWGKCLPDMESSFYFSGVTYATICYGDLVLPEEWRLFGPLEGLTGILMCGLSTAFYVGVIGRKILQRSSGNEQSVTPSKGGLIR
jgi:hypothetical protein